MKTQMSKADMIRRILAKNPRLTSSQLGREVGASAGYVRAALRRSKQSTIYGAGLSKGSFPRMKVTTMEASHE